MNNPQIAAKLELAQSRLESLQDLLQDTLYLARSATLPLHVLKDLQRAVNKTEATFYALANIRTRLETLKPTPDR